MKSFLLSCMALMFVPFFLATAQDKNAEKSTEHYQCMPCGLDCDKKIYDEPGKCPQCGMQLIKEYNVKFGSIQPSEVCGYVQKHPDVVLLDVRTNEEFLGKDNPNFGTLKNAMNITVMELESRLSTIDSLKNREIIVYCSHSHRSVQASYILTQNGFTKVINMAGGMSVMEDNTCKK
jgi:rhodanese-related sulfurtransferase